MRNYAEAKKELNRIKSEYTSPGDVVFRTAIQSVVHYGADTLRDDWNYAHIKEDSNELEVDILECAREIARVGTYDLLMYIQREVWLSNEAMDPQRVLTLLKKCLDWFADNDCECAETLEKFELLGLKDEEIEALGYGYMFDVKEEEDND